MQCNGGSEGWSVRTKKRSIHDSEVLGSNPSWIQKIMRCRFEPKK